MFFCFGLFLKHTVERDPSITQILGLTDRIFKAAIRTIITDEKERLE